MEEVGAFVTVPLAIMCQAGTLFIENLFGSLSLGILSRKWLVRCGRRVSQVGAHLGLDHRILAMIVSCVARVHLS